MADDDEIDVLGDFSFNSCLAQNDQGIPSCSSREDTVHPQWLLDSTATNWYDNDSTDTRVKHGPARKLTGNTSMHKHLRIRHSSWNQAERDLLVKEMAKYGRNVRKISQAIKTKSEAEIQALIEAEYGVNLDTPIFGFVKNDQEDVPNVIQEEIVTDDSNISNVLSLIATASPTITIPKHPLKKKNNIKNSLIKPGAVIKSDLIASSEIIFDDDLVIGSTESIETDVGSMDKVARNMAKAHKEKVKAMKKIGNHRRKVSRNFDRGKAKNSRDMLKSPQKLKKDSLLEENIKSPKMQIVLGSGQALPVSEGEQVIKIEKKASESDSDIEVDVDSDSEASQKVSRTQKEPDVIDEPPIAVPLDFGKFQPMPKRQKKINLDGGGGYTIMHTAAGDVLRRCAEPPPPRRRPAPRPAPPVPLIHCRRYNADNPAPYTVELHVSTLILMDAHAHTSRGEVMGLLGGCAVFDAPSPSPGAPAAPGRVTLTAYRAAAAAAGSTHCDMDPVSQAAGAEALQAAGLAVCGWHHSHPAFPPAPSAQDLSSQAALQRALERPRRPLLACVTAPHWPAGRRASQYRCFRVEEADGPDPPAGFQLSVRLVADLTAARLPAFLRELAALLRDDEQRDHCTVRMDRDICPQAGITYLEKCVSSISHHMSSAGYPDGDPVTEGLIRGLRDVFR